MGGGSARTILASVQRQEAQQGDKSAAAAGDKAMTMNHDGHDGKHSTVMFRNIFKFSKIKPVRKEGAVH
ncbi:unnamed protein product [Sphagnum troendelagicum]